MGCGQDWSNVELEHLVRAWVFCTEYLVSGIDQTTARFKSTIFEKFASFAPPDASEITYGGQTSKSVSAKFDTVSADVQKFRNAFHEKTSSSSSSFTETEVLGITTAIYMGKRLEMSYEAKEHPHSSGKNHPAFKVLRELSKFSDETMAQSMKIQISQDKVEEDDSNCSENQTSQQTPSLTETTAQGSAATTHSSASGAQDRAD